jgi:hypothetical protein
VMGRIACSRPGFMESIERTGRMSSSSKRQQTMAKRNREQAVKEKRALKLEKKHAAAAERNAERTEETLLPATDGPLYRPPAEEETPSA